MLTNVDILVPNNLTAYFQCECGKTYKHRQSLSLHKKKCLKNLEESIGNVDNIDSEKDLWIIKGQLRIINFIVNLENATNLALEELQDGNST